MKKIICAVIFVGMLTAIGGCSLFGGDSKSEKEQEREKTRLLTERQLYERVQDLLDDESYELSVKNLQLLESRFPFGVYADQSQLEIIYAYYRSGDEDAAIAAAERFLRLHPDHRDADYAWYMKGLANYSLAPGLFSRFYSLDAATKDVEPARQSFREFQEFLWRYPDSPYAADAQVRMIYIKHVLARHELVVANYYVKRRAYVAAINRAKVVLEDFQNTKAVADALALMAYCYYELELPDFAEDNITVLKQNFPSHPSLDRRGEYRYAANFDFEQKSWLNRLSFGLIDAPRAPVFDNRS